MYYLRHLGLERYYNLYSTHANNKYNRSHTIEQYWIGLTLNWLTNFLHSCDPRLVFYKPPCRCTSRSTPARQQYRFALYSAGQDECNILKFKCKTHVPRRIFHRPYHQVVDLSAGPRYEFDARHKVDRPYGLVYENAVFGFWGIKHVKPSGLVVININNPRLRRSQLLLVTTMLLHTDE